MLLIIALAAAVLVALVVAMRRPGPRITHIEQRRTKEDEREGRD